MPFSLTRNQKKLTWLSIPFKAYTVFGVIAFLVWHTFFYHYDHGNWRVCRHVGSVFQTWYFVCAAVLAVFGLLEMWRFKTMNSLFWGLAAFLVGMSFPMFYPA